MYQFLVNSRIHILIKLRQKIFILRILFQKVTFKGFWSNSEHILFWTLLDKWISITNHIFVRGLINNAVCSNSTIVSHCTIAKYFCARAYENIIAHHRNAGNQLGSTFRFNIITIFSNVHSLMYVTPFPYFALTIINPKWLILNPGPKQLPLI